MNRIDVYTKFISEQHTVKPEFVSEGKSVALLPATEVLFNNKKKVGISDIANQSEWKKHKMTVQVTHVTNWGSGKPKLKFVVGSGHGRYDSSFSAHHDQTGSRMGNHKVVNTVHLHNGEIVHSDNDLHLNDKAPVHVYK